MATPLKQSQCAECGEPVQESSVSGICPKCLLDQALQTGENDDPCHKPMDASGPEDMEVSQGEMIGRYKLLQKIGEGGFGVVYMAEQQEPVIRKVALKIIKRGMDTRQVIARFEAERQALAMMDHPNIAKVLDGGAVPIGPDRDRPYFVMELVRGIPITEFCDQAGFSTEQRLALFCEVCSAIQHAHQKGIIHRDLKPSNILVTMDGDQPIPKVIDFGIAKATQCRLTDKTLFTQFHQFVGTPAYMSPEQAQMSAMDADTRSDIYSLGVLLYELLTGRTPFDSKELLQAGFDEIRRRIREEDPPIPSTRLSTMTQAERLTVAKHRQTEPDKLGRVMQGELDWIVMKAMAKDRARRYETANALRLDIQRFQSNEPVTAAAPSVWYTLGKLARRNKALVGASVAVFAALLVGISIASWQAIRASRQAEIASAKTEEALQARNQTLAANVEEKKQREIAQANEQTANRLRYASDLLVASEAVREFDSKLGLEALESHIPNAEEADLRGWGWRYLWGKLHGPARVGRVFVYNQGLAVSQDGRRIAVSGTLGPGTPGGIQIVSVPDLQILQTLPAPRIWVDGMSFSEDGSRLFVDCNRGSGEFVDGSGVFEYNLLTGGIRNLAPDRREAGRAIMKSSPNHEWLVGIARMAPEHKLHAFAVDDGRLLSTSETYLPYDDDWPSHAFQISPDSTRVTIPDRQNRIRIYSLPDLDLVTTIQAQGEVSAIAWSPDGRWLASCNKYPSGFDLWEVATGHHRGSFPSQFLGPGRNVKFSRDGKRVVGCSDGNRMVVWNTDTMEIVQLLGGHRRGGVQTMDFLASHDQIVSVGGGTVKLWDIATPDPGRLSDPSVSARYVNFAISPNNKLLAVTDRQGGAHLFDLETERLITTLPQPIESLGPRSRKPWARQLAFSPEGNRLIVAHGDARATVYDIPSNKILFTLHGHTKPLINVACSPDGLLFSTTSEDAETVLWDATTGMESRRVPHAGLMAFHPDPATRWMAIQDQYSIDLMNVDTGERQRLIGGASATSLTFSPQGDSLAVGRHGRVDLYQVPDGKLLRTIEGTKGRVPSLAFHPDGHNLAIPSWSGLLLLWNFQVEKLVGKLPVPLDWTIEAEFSSDGNVLVASTRGGGLQIFRAPSWKEIEDTLQARELDDSVKTQWNITLAAGAQQLQAAAIARRDARLARFADNPSSINRWLLLGPIPYPSKTSSLPEIPQLDESALNPVEGKTLQIQGNDYAWKARVQNNPVFDFGDIFSQWASESGESSKKYDFNLVYAVSYVISDRDRHDVTLRIGCDDKAVLYVNGEEIYRHEVPRGLIMDQDIIPGMTIRKGVNRLVLKTVNRTGAWGASVRLTQADGSPLDGVHVVLNPAFAEAP